MIRREPSLGGLVRREKNAARTEDAAAVLDQLEVMARQDIGLEDIAAVLRHRSIETTALYAKVDLQGLAQVVQPWPEVTPC